MKLCEKKLLKIFFLLIIILGSACDFDTDIKSIPGNIRKFDPVLQLPKITEFAGERCVLTEILATYVKPDGTMDMKADYEPTVFYMYIRKYKEEDKKKSDAPIGVDQSVVKKREFESIGVKIIKPWEKFWKGEDMDINARKHEGMERGFWSKAILKNPMVIDEFENYTNAAPPMSFAEIWNNAIDAGAPNENTVAVIIFSPLWGYTFKIPNTVYKYEFDLNGNLRE